MNEWLTRTQYQHHGAIKNDGDGTTPNPSPFSRQRTESVRDIAILNLPPRLCYKFDM